MKFYTNMYGVNATPPTKAPVSPDPEKVEAPKVPAPAYQRLSGLKLTSSHMHEVNIGGKNVHIPSAVYVKLLEDQIKEMRRNLSDALKQVQRLTNSVNRLNQTVSKQQNELKNLREDLRNKVDRR